MTIYFRRDDIPSQEQLEEAGFRRFRKTHVTWAKRMDEPFEVETREGALRCEDGWLAVDSLGHPYPIAADEFERIYEPAE